MKKPSPIWWKWVCCLSPALVAILLYVVLPLFPGFTELVFVRFVFRSVSIPLGFLVSLLPFSITEICVLLLVPALLILLGIFIYRFCRSQQKKKTAEKAGRFVCAVLSVLALLFMIMHGGNYSRHSLTDLMQLENKTYDAEFLQQVTIDLAKKASAAREMVQEDENGCMVFSTSMTHILSEADTGYHSLSKTYPFLFTSVSRAKPVMVSHYWSYTGITGVYCPWLGEANVNTDVPHSGIPHTAAHELAHTIGFAREDACNFLGFLSCIHNENPDFIYSGYLSAYIYCSNALYRYDTKLWKQAALHCSDGVNRDLKQRNQYWKQFQGDVMHTTDKVNDSFIKFNGVETGVLNYNEAVSLILQYYDTFEII